MNIFNLFASLTLDKSKYEQGIKEAKKEGENFAEHTGKKVSPKAAAAWAIVIATVTKLAKTIVRLTTESLNYADTIGDLAAKYGVTTDAISEMQYIADQSSTSIEGLTSAMTMLLNRAKENGEGFKELGVNVYDTNGNLKQMDELFWETIGALNDIESEGERSRLMLETFGRSAMSVGEVLRKDSEELARMRKEAHETGVVLNESAINFASDFNDKMAVLKLQGQSALASMVAGTPDAEEKLQNFFDNLLEIADTYTPTFVNYGIRLLIQVVLALVRIAPSLASELTSAIIEAIFSTNWLQVGVDIAKAVVEGFLNIFISALNIIPSIFGVKIPKVDLGVGENLFEPTDLGGEYEISENINQKIEVEVKASGDSAVSQETAEKTAQALAPYIDKILGGM
ncbi:MAG: hypothetical protein IKW45_06700 [Clostridia bacterium]|nr:hypothetical protein [Clostridia bacterium]